MTKSLLIAAATALLMSAPVLQAQEASDETPAPPPAVLDTGEVVEENPPATDGTYVKETNGDWTLQCLRLPEGAEGEEPCQMYQLVKNPQGVEVAEVSLFRLEGGGEVVAGATVVTPLETLLTQKLSMQVDNGPVKRYDFSFCTKTGCYARLGFSAADIAQFKAGNLAKISIVPAMAPDSRVTVGLSLTGFTASYGKTSVLKQGN